jgi:hypothetical protein
MGLAKASLLALCVLLTAAPAARAQTQSQTDNRQIDLKPLLPPVIPQVLPPNSFLTPGSVGGASQSPYSSGPLQDSTQSAPAPGFRLTIPTR